MNIDLQEITKNNVGQLVALLEATIPVSYRQRFFDDLVSYWPKDNPLVRLGYHNEALVTAITARRETYDPENLAAVGTVLLPAEEEQFISKKAPVTDTRYRVYISTLSVLAPYRRRGAAKTLLKYLVDYCEKDTTIDQIYIHVHVDNAAAISLYESFGFTKVQTLENYYKNNVVTPPHAYLYIKTLRQ